MDKMLRLFNKGAMELNLPCTYIPELGSLRIVLGAMNYYFTFTLTPLNNLSSVCVAGNKYTMNNLLATKGFPVPQAIQITHETWSTQPLDELIKGLNFPLVAKPAVGGMRGRDVFCNIKDLATLNEYLKRMLEKYKFILIEELITHLKEYRLLVLKNKVIGVVERYAPNVTGDGEHTIAELIAEKNKERAILSTITTHDPLVYDEEYKVCLEEQGLNLQSIVPKNKKIWLCYTVNLGRGGDIYSLGKKIHPQNERLVCQAVKAAGLIYSGVDIFCEDINQPFNEWYLLEANSFPDITLHEIPSEGEKAPVAKKVLAQLIYRHPFSYLIHLCMRSRFSKYFKGLVGVVFILLFYLYVP